MSNCPSCGGVDAERIGSLPAAFHFCAFRSDEVVNGGVLTKCDTCNLLFRSPCLSQSDLDALYAKQPSSLWDHNSSVERKRPDFRSILEYLDSSDRQIRDVLDVGCFTGTLLSYLKTHCVLMRGTNLYGIEPSAEAASFAETVGINIIGTSVSGFSAEAHKFDLILMTDVFEHIVSSTDVIGRLTSSLRPNGRLVIVTGAYDSPTFSFWKSKYYYSAMPEHVVFITKGYAEWCARRLGLKLINYWIIENRGRTFPPAALKAFIKGFSYLLLNLLPTNWFAGKRQNWVQKLRTIRGYGMPNIFSKPDHALVIFEKIIPSQK